MLWSFLLFVVSALCLSPSLSFLLQGSTIQKDLSAQMSWWELQQKQLEHLHQPFCLRLGEHHRRGGRETARAREEESCCRTISSKTKQNNLEGGCIWIWKDLEGYVVNFKNNNNSKKIIKKRNSDFLPVSMLLQSGYWEGRMLVLSWPLFFLFSSLCQLEG